MASIFDAIIACITGDCADSHGYCNEKQKCSPSDFRKAEEIAEEVVQTLMRAEKGGKQLEQTIKDIVGINGWTEKLARWTLAKLEKAVQEAAKFGPVLKEAYDRVCTVAKETEGFILEHPVFCTVIALGILVAVAPWALEALGFGELGPIAESFAALWQARYAGYVPKRSLFSFFQRLGMKLKWY